MATSGKKAASAGKAAKKKPAASPKPRPAKSGGGGGRKDPPPAPLNYLIVASNGYFLRSGSTGEVRKLTPGEVEDVMPLLAQRQALGNQLTDLLTSRGYSLSASLTADDP